MDSADNRFDVVILGAGPAGLAAACESQRRGLRCLLLDRRGLAQSFVEYPQALRFFSPPWEMEIDGVPLPVSGGEKPTRETYLAYLRGVARVRNLPLATWESVTRCERLPEGRFLLETVREPSDTPGRRIVTRAVLVATGVWSAPIRLPCEGFECPQVMSEFHEPTPYFGHPVLVVGGGNSAVGAALSLAEAGASVALSMRRPPKDYRSGVRPFVRRDLGFAVEEGRVALYAETRVVAVHAESATLQPVRYLGDEDLSEGTDADYEPAAPPFSVPCRFVFSLIGHRTDRSFLTDVLGLPLRPDGRPRCDPDSWETEQTGIHLAGSVADPSLDIVLKLREQATQVVATIDESLARN